MKVRFKKLHPDAVTPQYKTDGAAGMDLVAVECVTIGPGETKAVSTGIVVEIPGGYEGQVRPRSGLAFRQQVTVLNAPGTIDSDFRGEIKVLLINHNEGFGEGEGRHFVLPGDRIAQLVIAPVVRAEMVETDEDLSATDRGAGGFGSTGK